MENDPWSQFPEIQEDDPWSQFPEVNQGTPPEQVAPEQPVEENTPFVDKLTSIGAKVINPVGAVLSAVLPEDSTLGKIRQSGQDFEEGMVGGVVNAAKNTAEAAAAISTYSPILSAYELLSGNERPEMISKIQDAPVNAIDAAMPEFHGQNTFEDLGALGSEIGVGLVAGNKVLAAAKAAGASEAAVSSLAEKAPKVINYFARLLTKGGAEAAGTSATVNSDVDTLVVGENALIPIMAGLDGKSESEAQAVLEKRMNIFMDAMILAAPVEMVADGGKAVFGMLWDSIGKPIQASFLDPSGKVKEGVAMQQLIQGLRDAIDPNNPNSKTADEYVAKVLELLKNEEEAVIAYPGLLKQGPQKVELDTAAIINRGLADDPSQPAVGVKTFFDKKSKEVKGQPGVQRTQIASEAPVRATERYLDEGYEAFGGSEGVNRARQSVVESGQKDVGMAEALQENAERDLADTKANYGTILSEDEGLGPRMLDAANQPGSRIGVDRNKITGEIVSAVRAGNEAVTKANRLKWQNIPEGFPVNEVELADSIAAASDAGALTPDIKKAFKRAGVDLDALMSDEIVEDAVVDFAKLQNGLRGPLSKAIAAAKRQGSGSIESLIDLRDNIVQAQPEWLAASRKKGAKKAVDAMTEAVEDTSQSLGPRARSGIPNRIRRSDAEFGLNKAEADQAAFEEIEKGMSKKSTPLMEHLVNTLSTTEYGQKHGLVVDLALADVADEMSTALRSDGVTGIKPKDILRSLKPFRATLNANPEKFKKELKRLDDFEEKLIANAGNADRLSELAKQYSKDAEKARKTIYQDALKEFFSKEGIPNPSGQKSFEKVFLDSQAADPENVGKIDDLISRMDPVAREGAAAAWMKTMKEQLFQADGSLSTTKTSQTLGNRNHLLTVGKKLLGDDDKIVGIIEELLNPSQAAAISKKSPSIKSAESLASEAATKRAANRLVLATKGPLTKFGGRVTSAVGTVLDWIRPDEINLKIADAIMADRKEFLRMFNDFATAQGKQRENLRTTFNWLVKMGIYNDSDSYEKWKKKAKAAMTEGETEEALK